MEARIDPILPRFGISGIGGDPKDKRGRKGAFEETLEKQKGNRKPLEERSLGDGAPSGDEPPKGRSITTKKPSDEKQSRQDEGTTHVDVVV